MDVFYFISLIKNKQNNFMVCVEFKKRFVLFKFGTIKFVN